VEAGYAQNLEDHISKNPELYGDIIVPLWQSVSYKGARYGVPQDSEVRMYFLNNDKLRKMGKTDKEIAACRPRWTRASSRRTTCAISPARRCRRAS
jgi:Maltose-binding periplasmic proteins/domains